MVEEKKHEDYIAKSKSCNRDQIVMKPVTEMFVDPGSRRQNQDPCYQSYISGLYKKEFSD